MESTWYRTEQSLPSFANENPTLHRSDGGSFFEVVFGRNTKMNNKKLTVSIPTPEGYREALPVRAIPLVTCWQRFSPDVVAKYLARKTFTSKNSSFFAYRYSEGEIRQMQPQEWDETILKITVYEVNLRKRKIREETPDEEPPSDDDVEVYYIWHKESIKLLPAAVFVWLNEFRAEFKADLKKVLFELEHQSDADLVLNPMTDTRTRKVVFEGLKTGNKLRRDSIDRHLDKAIIQAESLDTAPVFLAMKEMVISGEHPSILPFTGGVDEDTGGLDYTNDHNSVVPFTKKALDGRLARRRANGETPPLSPAKVTNKLIPLS